ncbi:hypothetical protein KIN20_018832 [Parelaphostrongylus tenuis]|uniref:Uncharacterized protein n=1 Tax=Parelaphostrongylus tenuis TaxID=148309 RepID=A0AAD5N7Z0_PARTN|nr:hypothetical protein KIN20_018832 [Parelaphostrongylus tenuis]
MDSTERLKPRSNFMRIERELYVFLRTIYGCGPKEPQWTGSELSEVLTEVEKKMWTLNLDVISQRPRAG